MEALIPYMPWIWVAIVVATIVWELTTFELNCLWFTIGATVALILSFFPEVFSPVIQLLIFALLSLILFFVLRKWMKKAMTVPDTPMNLDALIGKEVVVVSPIEKGKKGTVKVNGIIWNAHFDNKEDEAKADDIVVIARVEGNYLVVNKE